MGNNDELADESADNPADAPGWCDEDGVAIATLSTDMLGQIVAEWIAGQAGMKLPLQRHMQWGWSPGNGPVLLRGAVRQVSNVAQLKVRKP